MFNTKPGSNWAVLISGRGSNLVAFMQTAANIKLVVSSSAEALGLERARMAGIETLLTPTLNGKIDYVTLHTELERRKIDQIFLLGFMKILPRSFVEKWTGRMINLHPSILPAYPGLHSIEKSWEARDNMGASIHYVTAEVDAGEIIEQRLAVSKTQKLDLDWAETLVHIAEQQLVRKVGGQ